MNNWIKNLRTPLLLAAVSAMTLGTSFSAMANEYADSANALAQDKIKTWLQTDTVIDAVKAQNAKNASLSQADIDALDKEWRAGDATLIDSVLNNDLSKYLQQVKEEGQGLYTEIFVMDDKGLNVGQSDKTSDYWQGDEAKWQQTYAVGPDSMHLSDVEEDESSQTFQMQISLPIVDNGAAIGAVTVGVNAEMLE